jgi:acetyltransferase-like isoleucine patch superfamily enzyme
MVTKIIINSYKRLISVIERILNKLRITHFKLLGVKIGHSCYVGKGVVIVGNVTMGNRTVIGDYTCLSTSENGELIIGDDCHINSLSMVGSSAKVTIEDHCIFAPFIQITDATHEFDDIKTNIKDALITAIPVHIGENVWLGSGVVVLRGVTIGKGAVVGASSLVKKSLPEGSVSVGTPAKVIRNRKISAS